MKTLQLTAMTLAIALSSTTAFAENEIIEGGKTLLDTATNPASVSLELGTLGYGANIAWGINESIDLEAGWTGFNVDGDIEVGKKDTVINWEHVLGDDFEDLEATLNYELKASNPHLGLQVRPMQNWFTVGTGVIIPSIDASAKLTPTNANGEITVKGNTYTVNTGDVVMVNAENSNKIAPYATLGFHPQITNRFGAFAEIGAAYLGKFDTSVQVDDSIANAQNLKNDLEETISNNNSAWYPIAKVGATVRF